MILRAMLRAIEDFEKKRYMIFIILLSYMIRYINIYNILIYFIIYTVLLRALVES